MQDLIARMRKIDEPFNPPATLEQIATLEKALKIDALDVDLRALYLDHNGMPQYSGRLEFGLRLMPVDEVIKLSDVLDTWENTPHVRFFWSDDNSNYAGVYLSGVLKGNVCIFDHEEPDYAPRYRSVVSYCRKMLSMATREWGEEEMPLHYDYILESEYPLLKDWPDTDAADMALSEHFTRLYEQTADDEVRRYYAYCAMRLLPFSASDRLIPFLLTDDVYIPARAAMHLMSRRYEPALPHLFAVARAGRANGDSAALTALSRYGTPEAKKLVVDLIPSTRPGRRVYLMWALKDCGYETQRVGEECFYREPGAEAWISLSGEG